MLGRACLCIDWPFRRWIQQSLKPSKKETCARITPFIRKRHGSTADYLCQISSPFLPSPELDLFCISIISLIAELLYDRSCQQHHDGSSSNSVVSLLSNLETFALACALPTSLLLRSLAAFPALALLESPNPVRPYPLWTRPVHSTMYYEAAPGFSADRGMAGYPQGCC